MDPDGAGADSGGGADAAAVADAAIADANVDAAPRRCDPTAPFGRLIAMDRLNDVDDNWDESAVLSPDELTLYFASTRSGGIGSLDIYVATRTSRDDDFADPGLLAGVNTPNVEREMSISGDGLFLYAMEGAGECGGSATTCHISVATRPDTNSAFDGFHPVDALNDAEWDGEPYILPDRSAIYFVSNRNSTSDIFRAARSGDTFGQPIPVAGTNLATSAAEGSPVVTPDELNLYFFSNRDSDGGIYYATRTSPSVGFSDPVPLTEINSLGYVWPSWISADNCVLYFSYAHNYGNYYGNYDLYYAVRGQ
jgi:hypothetical protein